MSPAEQAAREAIDAAHLRLSDALAALALQVSRDSARCAKGRPIDGGLVAIALIVEVSAAALKEREEALRLVCSAVPA